MTRPPLPPFGAAALRATLTMAVVVAAAAVLFAVGAVAEASAQLRVDETHWPSFTPSARGHTEGMAPTVAVAPVAPGATIQAAPSSPTDAQPQAEPAPSDIAVATIFAAMASVGGLFVGARAASSIGRPSDDMYLRVFTGAAVGSAFGATVAVGIVQGDWGRAAVGSVPGLVAAAIVGLAVGGTGAGGGLALTAYGLTHGVVTAGVGGS